MASLNDRVKVVLEMSLRDAKTFVEDWEIEPDAPVLTGGYQENIVRVFVASIEEVKD